MVDYQTISIVMTGIGMIIALTYYALQIRNQNKTRTAQLYLNIWQQWNTKEFNKQRYDCYRMEWTDRKDFDEKYNVQNNPELFTSWNTFARNIAGLAELKKKGLIDLEFLDLMMLTDIMNWWRTFGEMTLESWKQGRYTWHSHFPFIEEVVKIDRVKRPWRYDRETGEYLAPHPRHRWIDPKEMMRIRKEMYQ